MPANLTVSKIETSIRQDPKHNADYIFYELTRSICPKCRRVIDAKIPLRDNKVYMHELGTSWPGC